MAKKFAFDTGQKVDGLIEDTVIVQSEEEQEFIPLDVGDMVRLNSGGPIMTIDRLYEGKFYCKWFVTIVDWDSEPNANLRYPSKATGNCYEMLFDPRSVQYVPPPEDNDEQADSMQT